MANSKRKCKYCGRYTPEWIKVPAGTFCTMDHALEFASQPKNKERAADKRHAAKKQKIRDEDRGYWLKKAQASFNAFIRARDKNLPCISCGRHHTGQYHAGHYRTVGANPELRFEELNCHKQCSACNNYLSGNLVNYRINLLEKIGENSLDWVEGPHDPKRYTIEELKEIDKGYREKAKRAIEE
jgi:hypothetical protein